VSRFERDRPGFGPKDPSNSSSPPLDRRSSGRVRAGARVGHVDAPPERNELDDLVDILARHLSAVNARILLERALQERNLSIDKFTRKDIASIGGPLRRGIELFVRPDKRKEVVEALSAFLGQTALEPSGCTVPIVAESDISVARNEARRLCEEMNAKSFAMHKTMTIVSELARNIVSYAKSGHLELAPFKQQRSKIVIRAVDSGPGIPNLQLVLSGNYQSRTGLGKGLLGTKQLADHFEISTGPTGTVVLAEVRL
jgi:serine/threonine-protein kinase RsbT